MKFGLMAPCLNRVQTNMAVLMFWNFDWCQFTFTWSMPGWRSNLTIYGLRPKRWLVFCSRAQIKPPHAVKTCLSKMNLSILMQTFFILEYKRNLKQNLTKYIISHWNVSKLPTITVSLLSKFHEQYCHRYVSGWVCCTTFCSINTLSEMRNVNIIYANRFRQHVTNQLGL